MKKQLENKEYIEETLNNSKNLNYKLRDYMMFKYPEDKTDKKILLQQCKTVPKNIKIKLFLYEILNETKLAKKVFGERYYK